MKIVALAGGVGGAKLAQGLSLAVKPDDLTVVVNTGDDFHHWGLKICPDLDTVCYTLAGLANPETGWGRQGESWVVLDGISLFGGEDWFKIGDRDLATHIERTNRLAQGQPISMITRAFCSALGVKATILPMTDDPVMTIVDTAELGELAFQDYFVRYNCEPTVIGFRFTGMEFARPAPGVLEAIAASDAVIFCPSNPWVSLDPILNVPGILPALKKKSKIAGVSPIIGGKTVKGPAAKMFTELHQEPSALSVAEHYRGLFTHFIVDTEDNSFEPKIAELGMSPFSTNTIMHNEDDRRKLAADVLNFIQRVP